MSATTKKRVSSQSRNRRVSLGVTYTILIILGIIWLVPLVWIVLSAFRCEYNGDTFIGTVTSNFFPKAYGLKNFKDLFTATYYGVPNAFPIWIRNTMIVAVVDCIISTFLVLSVAYCMSKL
ncbi:MAG: sugar ABC transporter permease, partial [Firmicutes bacterium]|nr:sugar ABC transporter permease [Bacillota bacterium]